MSEKYSFGVILDANVWVSEHLLKTAIGTATLLAISQGDGFIGLPEIVQCEVEKILTSQAEKAVIEIRKDIHLLNHLSGTSTSLIAPDQRAILKGIRERWRELEGVLKRIPFAHRHAKSALHRIMVTLPPCSSNNEQFRDCCIWEAALEIATECPVHLVTNDSAFYEGRNRCMGLSKQLLVEVKGRNLDMVIHNSLGDFLASMKDTMARLDEATLSARISEVVTPIAHDIVAENRKNFETGEPFRSHIKGFATPKQAILAVSFVTNFELTYVETKEFGEDQKTATLTLEGTCSYSQTTGEVSEIQIESWWIHGKHEDGRIWGWSKSSFQRRYSNMRVIQ